jgi:multisubunit Na+/H+ antiporter MnhC subunit
MSWWPYHGCVRAQSAAPPLVGAHLFLMHPQRNLPHSDSHCNVCNSPITPAPPHRTITAAPSVHPYILSSLALFHHHIAVDMPQHTLNLLILGRARIVYSRTPFLYPLTARHASSQIMPLPSPLAPALLFAALCSNLGLISSLAHSVDDLPVVVLCPCATRKDGHLPWAGLNLIIHCCLFGYEFKATTDT